jgi:S1-C subfamily serine protease
MARYEYSSDLRPLDEWKSLQRLFLCGVSAIPILIAGCATPGGSGVVSALKEQTEIRKRQETSLLGPGPSTIRGEPAKVFVGNRRWMIVPRSSVTESASDKIITVELKDHFGTATPLTADGYFLTAAHVIEKEAPVALNNMDARPARIVKVFPKADLALIKFPFTVSRFCENLATDVRQGDYVYSDAAKGTVNRDGVSIWKNGIRSIECDLPSGSGQSGGPVINSSGELVGVLVGGYYVRLSGRMTTDALVTMVRPDVLRQLIESDRMTEQVAADQLPARHDSKAP